MSILKKNYKKLFPRRARIQIRKLIWKINSIWLIGNKVTCNCCHRSFRHFLAYGDYIKRINALCPNCLSLERTRMLWEFLTKSSYLQDQNRVLHFSPARVLEKKLLKNPSIKYQSADIDPLMAMEVVDIMNIKYQSNLFDVIICSHVLSVVKEDLVAIEELYRVLKKNGTLIFLEHIYQDYEKTYEDFSLKSGHERMKAYGKHYLMRCYGKDLSERFLKRGFSSEVYNITDHLTSEKIKKHGLQNSGVVFLFKKT